MIKTSIAVLLAHASANSVEMLWMNSAHVTIKCVVNAGNKLLYYAQ